MPPHMSIRLIKSLFRASDRPKPVTIRCAISPRRVKSTYQNIPSKELGRSVFVSWPCDDNQRFSSPGYPHETSCSGDSQSLSFANNRQYPQERFFHKNVKRAGARKRATLAIIMSSFMKSCGPTVRTPQRESFLSENETFKRTEGNHKNVSRRSPHQR